MVVLITCKNEEGPIKTEGPRVLTTFSLYGNFSRRSRAANSAVLSSIWPNFEPFRYIKVVLITCKNEEDVIINEGARVLKRFSPL